MQKAVYNHETGQTEIIQFTSEEKANWDARNAAYDADENNRNATAIRKERNNKLAATDWTQTVDTPQATKDKYATYRQSLRDVPTQAGFPWTIEWPVAP